MSDGKYEAYRDNDLWTAPLYTNYKTNGVEHVTTNQWQEPQIEFLPKHMPNQKWHKIISFIKSGVRILGYAFLPFDLVIATGILIFSEVIGIVEELV
tara:strand:- start:201 stop:491 length:291 start_codon:yes stop_codon:yes gene_type:complete